MTTIAWDGKTLASDRQAHHGPSNTKYECKKLRVLNGMAIAGAGIKYLNDAMTMYAEILKILTLSMANFHSPKLGSAIIPLTTVKHTVNFV